MSVVKRGSVYHYRFMLDGTLHRGSTKETAPGKARQFEAMLITRIRQGQYQAKKAPLLEEFAAEFTRHIDKQLEASQLAPNSVRNYKNGVRLLIGTKIARMRLDQIGTADAAELSFPGGPSNGNMALRTLHRMLSYACELNLLRAAPKINLLEKVGREAVIEPWIEDLLLEFSPDYLADVIAIMLDCGMRPEEVCRMRWEHVHWGRNAILVPKGKSERSRRFVGMTDRMRMRLKAIQNDTEWVFPSDGGKSGKASATGHRVNLTKAWGLMLKAVKIRIKEQGLPALPADLVLYSARHTFATNFLANGGDLSKLMVLMGHASIMTTQKYLHPSTSDAAEVMNRHNRNKAGLRIVKSA